jgi:cytochrome c oxidase cbb3-type subunit II
MTFRQFAIGLTLSFLVAFVAMVGYPAYKTSSPAVVSFDEAKDGKTGIYHPKTAGRVVNGAQVYAENGCYLCHTQVIRTTDAGDELGRPDWAGLKSDEERGDTRRESNVFDYLGESYAQIGANRLGPDLSNFGRRVESIYAKGGNPRQWVLMHLWDPRNDPARATSACPSVRFLFTKENVYGAVPSRALPVDSKPGTVIVPGPEAEALVDYLLSLKRDQTVPAVLNYAPAKPADKKG